MVLRKDELETKLKDETQLIKSGVLRDENPLDLSPEFEAFLEACRRGEWLPDVPGANDSD